MCILSARRVYCPAERVLHMAATNVPDGFRKSPLCYSLTAEQVEKLFGLFKRKAVAAGGTICLENMQGEALYLIEKGTVRISKMLAEGDEQVMAILGPKDLFGEMAVFAGENRSASARVEEDVVLYSLSRSDYELLAQSECRLCLQLTRNIVSIFSRRLRAAQQDYRDMLLAAIGRNG